MEATAPPSLAPDLAARLRSSAPAAHAALERLHAAAPQEVAPDLLELARLRLAMLLDDGDELDRRKRAARTAGLPHEKVAALAAWPDSPLFSPGERACLAFVEQFAGDVGSLSDAQAAAVLEQLGPASFHAFVVALLALDQHQRLRLALARLFPEDLPA